MKVKLVGFDFLRERLTQEGCEFVGSGEELFLNEQADGELPKVVLSSLGIKTRNEPERFGVMKFFHNGFSPQTIVTLPVWGMMPGNLGANIQTALAARFIPSTPPVFENEDLSLTLAEMNYTGFVTAGFGQELCSLRLGAGMAFYNVMEGIPGLLIDFLTGKNMLLESWTYSVLLSRFPYPAMEKADRVAFSVDPQARGHLWFFKVQRQKNAFFTADTRIGIATSWATTLHEAARRVLRTLEGINIPEKQYRTDLTNACRWYEVKEHQAVS